MDKIKYFGGFRSPPVWAGVLLFIMLSFSYGYEASAKGGKSVGPSRKGKTAITITSESMKADRTSKTVTFKGEVEAREDFLLCSDELYMYYTEANEVTKIDARGHVRIYRSSGVAMAKRAEYDRKKHILLLSGDAVVERCSDTVRGDKITLYLDDDSALVEGVNKGRVKAVIIPEKKCPGEGEPQTDGAPGGTASGVIDVENTHCKISR